MKKQKVMDYCGRRGVMLLCAVIPLMTVPPRADGIEGMLSAESGRVSVGETAKILVSASGEGSAAEYRIEQPRLPEMPRLSLAGVSQSNETVAGAGGERFTVRFLYTLTAKEAGKVKVPDMTVRYKKEGDEKENSLTVKGLTIEISPAAGGKSGYLVGLGALAAGIGALALLARRARRKRHPAEKASAPAPADLDAPVVALSRLEDASQHERAGDMAAWCTGVRDALRGYLETRDDEAVRDLAAGMAELCERVKYAADEAAGRRVAEVVRRAELHFKEIIRADTD